MQLTRRGLAAVFATMVATLGAGMALIANGASARGPGAVCTYCESTTTTSTSTTGIGVPVVIGGGQPTTSTSTTPGATPTGTTSSVNVTPVVKALGTLNRADPVETVEISSAGQLTVSASYTPVSTAIRRAHAASPAKAKSKAIVIYTASLKAKKAGAYKLKLTLTKAGTAALKPLLAHGRHPTIRLAGTVTFKPTHGATVSKSFTVSSKLNFKLT